MIYYSQDERVLQYWRQDKKSIGEILKALDWSPRSSKNLVRVLRENREHIPFGLRGDDLRNLTIDNRDSACSIEHLLFMGAGEPDIQEALKQVHAYQKHQQKINEFGTLLLYESRYARVTKLQKGNKALIVLDGSKSEVRMIAEKIEEFYTEKGFEKLD